MRTSLYLCSQIENHEANICKKYFEGILGKTSRFRTVFKNLV